MNYDLAKKLKEAGFPYGQYSFNVYFVDPKYKKEDAIKEAREKGLGFIEWVIGVPTLSELIQALKIFPDQFVLYANAENRWEATFIDCNIDKESIFSTTEIGLTAEESVANLWLKLNKI